MLMMLGLFRRIVARQVKRRGDDADDVGPLLADWAPAGNDQGR